jgi:hypothetical protein
MLLDIAFFFRGASTMDHYSVTPGLQKLNLHRCTKHNKLCRIDTLCPICRDESDTRICKNGHSIPAKARRCAICQTAWKAAKKAKA